MGFLSAIGARVIEWALSKLSAYAVTVIKAQVKKSKMENKINKEVLALENALKEAEKAEKEHNRGVVPDDIEKKIRDAARRLNGNFI